MSLALCLAVEDPAPGPGRFCVLIVDDEEDIRESLRSLLEAEFQGVRVFTARTGFDALDVLDAHRVDLVVADFRMPGMDGLKVLERVKRRAPGTRRGLITAYDPQPERHNLLSSLDLYLRKPLSVDVFLEAIRRSMHPR